jgi:hypothetical protein
MYSDKLTQIVDAIFIDINNIHHLSKQTISELLNKLMSEHNSHIRECLIELRNNSEDKITYILDQWILCIKNNISIFLNKTSTLIYNSVNPTNLYITLFDNISYLVQLINIIFRKIFDEYKIHEFTKKGGEMMKANETEIIHKFFYNTWFKLVYTKNCFKINNSLCDKINTLRNKLLDTPYIELISSNPAIDYYSVFDADSYLNTIISCDLTGDNMLLDDIIELLTMINTLDNIMNDTLCYDYFRTAYMSNITSFYNFFTNKLDCFKTCQEKITDLSKLIVVENFINNIFDEHTNYFTKFFKKIISNNFHLFLEIINDTNHSQLLKDIPELLKIVLTNQWFDITRIINIPNIGLIIDLCNVYDANLIIKMKKYYSTVFLDIFIDEYKLASHESNKDTDITKYIFKIYILIHKILKSLFDSTNTNNSGIEITTLDTENIIKKYINKLPKKSVFALIIDSCQHDPSILKEDIELYLPPFINNFTDIDEIELLFKNSLCKELVYKKVLSDTEFTRFRDLCHKFTTINLLSSVKIMNELVVNNDIVREYNMIYTTNGGELNARVFTDGLVSFKPSNSNTYYSDIFKAHLNTHKSQFADFYSAKCENKHISWCDQMSTIDLEFTFNNRPFMFRCRYSQADLLFLLENEYLDLCHKPYYTRSELAKIREFNSVLAKSSLISYLKKNKFIKKEEKVWNNTPIIMYRFDDDCAISSKKTKYDFYKLKELPSVNTAAKDSGSGGASATTDTIEEQINKKLCFERIDYIKCYVIRICKSVNENGISKSDVFNGCIDKLNGRFVLTEELFSKAVDKLIELDFINKCADKLVYVP